MIRLTSPHSSDQAPHQPCRVRNGKRSVRMEQRYQYLMTTYGAFPTHDRGFSVGFADGNVVYGQNTQNEWENSTDVDVIQTS